MTTGNLIKLRFSICSIFFYCSFMRSCSNNRIWCIDQMIAMHWPEMHPWWELIVCQYRYLADTEPMPQTNVQHSLFDLAILATYVLISDYLMKIIGFLDFSLNNKNSNWMLLSHVRTIPDIKKGFWTFWGREKTLEVIGNIVNDQFYWPVYYYYIHPWRKSNPQLTTDY